ncbi:sigma-54 dependent transcriptional regulator [Clostridium estertheticum]|uniref:sigma-54-dependent transcriptional regulator n=1 Tax=Clostridium estertheticum TaxID=238834 RepID=UPI0013E8FFD0|nr:sigma-54 dependent transcriptional regulator [Clostridium estertheticum]MBZ9688901.1 sigma-54 dependent transcriptional regulator [Clostridium estertheticum]
MGKILVIDDEEYIGWVIKKAFEPTSNQVSLCLSGKAGLLEMQRQSYDLIFLDLRLPDIDGMDLLLELKKIQQHVAVIIITAHGSIDTAIECMKRGAFDYITKPFDVDELLLQAQKAMEMGRLRGELSYLRGEVIKDIDDTRFSSNNERVNSVFRSIAQVAETTATVLITGENGTGKELLARRIHQKSNRENYAFVVYNCSTESEITIDSELFGSEKTNLIGEMERTLGKFELADNGTIFIEEVGAMSLSIQAKLLRLIEEKEFQRVGSNSNIKIDVRIIATSSKNLAVAIDEGTFREDLYYRLNVLPLELPPLRQRKEDIIDLVDYFIKKYDIGEKISEITPEAIKFLKNYHWPGNIRELENVVERIVILSEEKTLRVNNLPMEILGQRKNIKEPIIYFPEEGINLEVVERELILKALKLSGQNQSKAAGLLSITRSALIYRMQKHHID